MGAANEDGDAVGAAGLHSNSLHTFYFTDWLTYTFQIIHSADQKVTRKFLSGHDRKVTRNFLWSRPAQSDYSIHVIFHLLIAF